MKQSTSVAKTISRSVNLLRIVAPAIIICMILGASRAKAQQNRPESNGEQYGNVLNLGLGVGYFGYLPQPEPYFLGNYELNVSRNFTLAPFLGFASFRQFDGNVYWNQYYHETVVPIGVKGTYYFDELLNAPKEWDFYAAASLGFSYSHISWDNGNGSYGNLEKPNPLFLTIHIGAEYHVSKRTGIYLDLANGLSTAGIALHNLGR